MSRPCQFGLFNTNAREVSLERLLNIAELALKYCLASYEEWAITKLYHQLTSSGHGSSILKTACPSICSRILNVAALSGYKPLLRLVEKQLVVRILWTGDVETANILEVAAYHGFKRICGAIYYRSLLDYLEQAENMGDCDKGGGARPDFSSIQNTGQRKAMETAFKSLSTYMESISNNAPPLEGKLCPQHGECSWVWTRVWTDAVCEAQSLEGPGLHWKVSVLGRLRTIAFHLRKTLPAERQMSVACTLAALETVAGEREQVIDGLIAHFHLGQTWPETRATR